MTFDYDLLVIGCGPGGHKAAIQAAKLGRKVAVIERTHMIGGVCTNTGTIPSKTMREAVLYLTGMSQREMYGQSYRVSDQITIEDLFWRTQHVIDREIHVIRDQLSRNHITMISGEACFLDPHTLSVVSPTGDERRVSGDKIVIAVGTRPAHPPKVAFDGRTILDSDGILNLQRIPGSMVVVGGGVIGIEYASMFAALGTKVTVVERRQRLLEFCDSQVVEALQYHLRGLGVTFRFGESVVGVDAFDDGTITHLESGKKIPAEVVLYSAGREGATHDLALFAAGLEAEDRGRIRVGPSYQTDVDHIYAVGDVIGFPSLAATSSEQGRLAACCAFDEGCRTMGDLLPIGIYTIPEISFVGKTEEELTSAAIPYEIGVARYRELARGHIVGDTTGVLKLLVSAVDRTILGVHVFGQSATELVHVGQAVMALNGTVDYLVDAVFNYPTLSEAYKVAALDATNKMRAVTRIGEGRIAA